MISINQKYKSIVATFVSLIMFVSCDALIEVDAPGTSINAQNVYDNEKTASAVLVGIYSTLSNSFRSGGLTGLSLNAELSSDILKLYDVNNAQYQGFFLNNLQPSSSFDTAYWRSIYNLIYVCNAAVEGLDKSRLISFDAKQQLLGEARFMRAFLYFYLINLYGDAPLILTTDYKLSQTKSRTSTSEIYSQIVLDLKEAQSLLKSEYLDATLASSTSERIRPNSSVATALLARVYLYLRDFPNAEAESTKIIENASSFEIISLHDVFLKNSRETIWALQPVAVGYNTDEGYLLSLSLTGPDIARPFYLSPNLINSFEWRDNRKTVWSDSVTANSTKYYFPTKYKVKELNQPVTEYTVVFRLAEQYLIRAEARAQQNKISGAISDLDIIRERAGLPLLKDTNPTISMNDFVDQLLRDRRLEFFTEWGHRWLDLKRLGRADEFLAPVKGNTWEGTDVLYPIPERELASNSNLIQNPGYN